MGLSLSCRHGRLIPFPSLSQFYSASCFSWVDVVFYGVVLNTMAIPLNQHAGGKGGVAPSSHVVRSWPAPPQHGRYMRAARVFLFSIIVSLSGCSITQQNVVSRSE